MAGRPLLARSGCHGTCVDRPKIDGPLFSDGALWRACSVLRRGIMKPAWSPDSSVVILRRRPVAACPSLPLGTSSAGRSALASCSRKEPARSADTPPATDETRAFPLREHVFDKRPATCLPREKNPAIQKLRPRAFCPDPNREGRAQGPKILSRTGSSPVIRSRPPWAWGAESP